MKNTRRDFIKKTAGTSAAIAAGGVLPGFSAKSYNRIIGANDKIRVSVAGVNSRGSALARNFALQKNCDVIHVCDVDKRAIDKCCKRLESQKDVKARGFDDFRKSLESKDVDAFVIAMPDHWHAPASLLALQAGKHVYVEKPCSHNPAEGEILRDATAKYKLVVQMGNQRRSWPNVIKAIEEIKNGVIGRAYYGKGWYAANRGPIGNGKVVAPPDWLDWDFWQGPAPRKAYKDNIVHYNWHWIWHWGTGEALNNGTHMVDLLRWGMSVDYPTKVSSSGGRYHFAGDDWETPDTQVINLDFADKKSITWEGRSCNGKSINGSGVAAIFYGEKGSLQINGNSYLIYDRKNKVVKNSKDNAAVNALDRSDPSKNLDALHIQNFFRAITSGEKLNADIDSGHKSTLLVQLGNIAQRTGRSLNIDPKSGHILSDKDALKLWSRQYEAGWEMKL